MDAGVVADGGAGALPADGAAVFFGAGAGGGDLLRAGLERVRGGEHAGGGGAARFLRAGGARCVRVLVVQPGVVAGDGPGELRGRVAVGGAGVLREVPSGGMASGCDQRPGGAGVRGGVAAHGQGGGGHHHRGRRPQRPAHRGAARGVRAEPGFEHGARRHARRQGVSPRRPGDAVVVEERDVGGAIVAGAGAWRGEAGGGTLPCAGDGGLA